MQSQNPYCNIHVVCKKYKFWEVTVIDVVFLFIKILKIVFLQIALVILIHVDGGIALSLSLLYQIKDCCNLEKKTLSTKVNT